MGCSYSEQDNPEKFTSVEKVTLNETNEKDLGRNRITSDLPKTDTRKTKVLQDSNNRLRENTTNSDNNSFGSPRIDLPNAIHENIEVDEKSAKEAKRDAERQEQRAEIQKREAAKKRKHSEATAGARVSSLRKQLDHHVEKFRKQRKGSTALVEFETLDGLRDTLKRLQRTAGCEIMTDDVTKRMELLEKYEALQRKKSGLTLRVSELAGVQLKHNNPNIADLSDENRASKLAEKFSELYDNEYTDLYEVYHAKLEKHIGESLMICHIRDSLKFCYQECKTISDRQRQQLLKLLHKDNSVDPVTTAAGLQLRIKEFQKKVANVTIPHIQTSVHSRIVNHQSLKTLIQRIGQNDSSLNPKLRTFLNRCTEFSWYTQIQDPPVALDFTFRKNTGDYRSYTKSGSEIDFIVWPVLLLHEQGPILSKGTAQFKSNDTENSTNTDTLMKKDTNTVRKGNSPDEGKAMQMNSNANKITTSKSHRT